MAQIYNACYRKIDCNEKREHRHCVASFKSPLNNTRLDLYKLNSILSVTYFAAARLQNTVFSRKINDAKTDKMNKALRKVECERD